MIVYFALAVILDHVADKDDSVMGYVCARLMSILCLVAGLVTVWGSISP